MMAQSTSHADQSIADRREWIALLSTVPVTLLEAETGRLEQHVFRFLANPEIGLVMVRGRPGGSPTAFNLGEMTVTRCVVSTTDSASGEQLDGHGHVAGRDRRHAELAAQFDAYFQDGAVSTADREAILAPMRTFKQKAKQEKAAKTAATKVEFFTMVRGD